MAHGWHHKLDKACGLASILLAHTQDYLVGWPFFSNTTATTVVLLFFFSFHSPVLRLSLLIVCFSGKVEARHWRQVPNCQNGRCPCTL
jgi:hypothetical protein